MSLLTAFLVMVFGAIVAYAMSSSSHGRHRDGFVYAVARRLTPARHSASHGTHRWAPAHC